MNLGQAFERAAARKPRADAVVEGHSRRSYGEWLGEVRAIAGGLRARGIKPGDHVAAVMRNRLEMASLAWACYMIGAVFTPISWRGTADEIGYCLEDAEARIVAFDGGAEEAVLEASAAAGLAPDGLIAAADAETPSPHFRDLAEGPAVGGASEVDERETCIMLYTSGTTGRPKGVPRSHRAELAAAMNHIAMNRYPFGLSSLCVMPLFHTMGVRVLLCTAILGGKLVCMPAYSPDGVMDLIERERIGGIFLVPTMYHDIIGHPGCAERDLSSVVRAGFAGMPMAPSLVQRCVARFPGGPFVNFYGSSEIYAFAACDHVDRKPACAGQAGPNQEIRVVASDPERKVTGEDVLPQGETGEIIANMLSPDAFGGYWKRPDADEKSIRGGWYFTGDLGMFDEDGELFVLGRVDDMIISGGENIHPEEVEDALLRSGLVTGAVVVGLPDERMGQRVVAFVEPANPGVSHELLDEACRAGALSSFKRPRGYAFIEAIPRSASGKLLRRKLREGDYALLPDFDSTI